MVEFNREEFRSRVRKAVERFLAEDDRAESQKGLLDQAEAEVLSAALEVVRPMLPMIAQKLPNGRRGVALVEGKAETYLYEDGTLEGTPSELAKSFDVTEMLKRLVALSERQAEGKAGAADRFERRARKLCQVLRLVVACLESLAT